MNQDFEPIHTHFDTASSRVNSIVFSRSDIRYLDINHSDTDFLLEMSLLFKVFKCSTKRFNAIRFQMSRWD